MSKVSNIWIELKRRKVIRVAVAYIVVAWLMVEVSSVMFPGLHLPEWTVTLVIALAVLGFPVSLALAWALDVTPEGIKLESDQAKLSESAVAKATISGDSRSSVAVLPFVNLSNDPDNEYFSDGISEELLNLLCKVPTLTVASRTSSFSFKGQNVDLATVASKLEVDVILEGSVRRSGDRVRITAQLIDGATDRNLWSANYDRQLRDVFEVQDEIAQNIVDALKISLSPDQRQLIRPMSTTSNVMAYDFYLRGRYFLERSDSDNALVMFEKAVEQDNQFAAGYAGIAESYAWKFLWVDSDSGYVTAANEYSALALEKSPDSAEAHAARCLTLAMSKQFKEAIAEAEKAIAIDPRLYEAYYYKGRAHFANGEYSAAADAFEGALEIRPDDNISASLLSTTVNSFGTEAEKRAASQRAVEISERYLSLNPDDAVALSRTANDYVYLGEIEKGLELAERAYNINPKYCGYNVACAFMLAGRTEAALDYLDEHSRLRSLDSAWIEHDSDWDEVRDHPRFKALLERLRSG
ncbi:MAG TPA: tetratricopeptide repeat protein [Xanthomonadales bacterium]|nr:tetratricopeptide repeat protein [Xanthomonadales bacterium]